MDFTYVCQRFVGNEIYNIHKYFVPIAVVNRIKFLRKYFKIMDRDDTPYRHKKRKNYVEFLETALMILARVDTFISKKIPVVAGSGDLSPLPWATFGFIHADVHPQFEFDTFGSITKHYNYLIHENSPFVSKLFAHRREPFLARNMADMYNCSSHMIVSLAICLLYDILIHCGPDCEEFYDLFTNDNRIRPSEIQIPEWEKIRCKVMGSEGSVSGKKWKVNLGQYYTPKFPNETTVKFEELPENNDISHGEKVKLFNPIWDRRKVIVDHCFTCMEDYGTTVELDDAYYSRVSTVIPKYHKLGIIP